jgi:hypothetical protein
MQARLAARHRQGERRRARVADTALELEAGQEEVGAEFERAREGERLARDDDLVEAQAAGVGADARETHAALPGEEVAVVGRHERRERAREVGGEGEPLRRLTQGHVAGGDAGPVGVEGEVDVEVLQRSLALQGEVDGRAPLDPEGCGDEAARWLAQAHVELELAGDVGEGRAQAQVAAGAVGSGEGEVGVDLAALEGGIALRRQLRRLAEHRLAETEAADLERLDPERERELRQGEGLGLGIGEARPGRRGRQGRAEVVDLADGELAHLDAAQEERAPAPVDRDVVDPEPDAVGVGHGDLGDGRAGGQDPRDAGDAHLAPRPGKQALDEADEKAVLLVGGIGRRDRALDDHLGVLERRLARQRRLRLLAHDDRGPDDERDEEEGRASQNACPMPM